MTNLTPDVLVVGAGSAGAAVAARMAEKGLRVVVCDRRRPEEAGANWINAVPAWLFDEARVAQPEPPELVRPASTHSSVLADAHGHVCTVVPEDPGMHVNMRLLTDRLQRRAVAAGAELVRGRVVAVELVGARVAAVSLADGSEELTIRPRLTVDASGISGAIRRRVPMLDDACPAPAKTDLCMAAQHQFTVEDRAGAEAFLALHGAQPGDNVTRTGVVGGYSILMVNVAESLEEVGVLSGSIPADGVPSGAAIVDRFVRSSGWIGRRLMGGEAPIPLGQPYTRLTAPGAALIGDSANHVYGLHGSGVGMGLIAARVLADVAAAASDPGDAAALHRYPVHFLRRYGGRLAGADLFRRVSQSLDRDEISDLLRSGLLGGPMLLAGLKQTPFKTDRESLQTLLVGAIRHPRHAARLAPTATRLLLVQRAFESYPDPPDSAALQRFDRLLGRLRGF